MAGYCIWLVDPDSIEANDGEVAIVKHRVRFPPGVEPSDELLQDSRDAKRIAELLARELGYEGEVREKIGRPIRIARS